MTRALAHQLPPSITVNTLSPGWTRTSFIDFNRLLPCAALMQMRQRHWSRGTMAVLLASEEAKGITGQEISVDAGYKV